MQDSRRQLTAFAACFLLAVAFLSVFSNTTSWLFHGQQMTDSAIFMTVGRCWTEGLLPYRDLFDTKGPYLYVINALGYLIAGSRVGVFILQAVSLTIAFFFAYKLFRLNYGHMMSLALTLLCALSLSSCMEGGNSAEEYILPCLFASFYLLLKWISSRPVDRHPVVYSFVYGLTFGVALMTRPTDALGLAGILLAGLIWLLAHARASHTVNNILSFLAGIAVFLLPFLIYLFATSTWDDFLYACYTFNFSYLSHSDIGIETWQDVARWLKSFFVCYFFLIIALLLLRHRADRWRGLFWTSASLLPLLWFVCGQGYGHYAIICAPYFCLTVIELRHLWTRHHSRVYGWLMMAFLGITLAFGAYELRSSWMIFHEREPKLSAFQQVMSLIPETDEGSVATYGDLTDFYYYTNLSPHYPYFVIQQMGCERDSQMKRRVRTVFEKGDAHWIVVSGRTYPITDILHRRYASVYRSDDGSVSLYHIVK